ncbi:MAG TPA: YeeE/YedE family protein [Methylophilus sp.]
MQKTTVVAWLAGVIFGLGLILSGMTNPYKVRAFLDISRDWDPSLMLVMLGAIAVAFVGFRFSRHRSVSLLGEPLHLPGTTVIDGKLLAGAALFGIGWGLAGFCPGPAIVALMFGSLKPWIFVASMLAGMWLHGRWQATH